MYKRQAPDYEAGRDAVIVQDMGVFSFIRRNFPDLDIHASTQMTVTGPEGMKFLEEKGATRVAVSYTHLDVYKRQEWKNINILLLEV